MKYFSLATLWLALLPFLLFTQPEMASTTVTAYPNKIILASGEVKEMANGRSALAEALEQIPQGGVIFARGAHPGITLGSGSTSGKFSVYRKDALDATIMGDESFSFPSLTISGGIVMKRLEISDYTVRGRGVLRPIVLDMGTNQGKLVLRHGVHQSDGKTQFAVRLHGTCEFYANNLDFSEPGQEHPLYIDNTQGMEVYRCVMGPWGRTGIQIDTRTFPSGNLPPNGDVFIAGNRIIGTGSSGGSAITIAGHINGSVHIGMTRRGKRLSNTVQSNEETGGYLAYLDQKQFLLQNPTAPPNERVVIGNGYVLEGKWAVEDLHVYDAVISLPNTKRFIMAFGSVKNLTIYTSRADSSYIRGSKWALDAAHLGKECGTLKFVGPIPPSEWDWETLMPEFVKNKEAFDPDPLWTAPE